MEIIGKEASGVEVRSQELILTAGDVWRPLLWVPN